MRLLREPLFQFLLAGVLLFVGFRLANPNAKSPREQIEITVGLVDHLTSTFQRTWQRPPTDDELSGLIREHIRDEVAYREALNLGLDRDDSIVRRRMRQKLEFLSEETLGLSGPTEEELLAFLNEHADRYRFDPEFAFQQVFINPEKHEDPRETARRLLSVLETDGGGSADLEELGDTIMLPAELGLAPLWQVRRTFGGEFAESLAGVPPGVWSGPINSGYGLHLVRVRETRPARMPDLDEVRDAVVRDYNAVQKQETLDRMYEALTAKYEIVFEDPAMAGSVEAEEE